MLTLNLFPKKEREELNLERYYFLLKKIIILFFVVVLFISFVLFASKHIIKYDLDNITEQNNIVIESNKELNESIKEKNLELKKLSEIHKENVKFSAVLLKIIDIIPKEISLELISLDLGENAKNKVISLKLDGFAETRESLINFKNILNSNDFIQEVNFPITNLLKQKDIKFEISTNIYLDKIYE